MVLNVCARCGDPAVRAKGRCAACYEYRRRHGEERPLELIIRQTERDVELELERRWAS